MTRYAVLLVGMVLVGAYVAGTLAAVDLADRARRAAVVEENRSTGGKT